MSAEEPVEPFIEVAYDRLAQAIDTAGQARENLFLAKLALALAHEIGDVDVLDRLIALSLEAPD